MQNRGVTVEHALTNLAIAKITLEYRGRFVPPTMSKVEIECEVYKVDGVLSVHTACPKCRHSLMIDGRNKNIELQGDKLFIEPFECTWEMGGNDDHHAYGFGLCQLKLAYDGKVAKDA